MAEILLDTDVLYDHLCGVRRLTLADEDVASYSVLTRTELLAMWPGKDEVIGWLLGPFREIAVDRGVADKAGQLARGNGVGTVDALIAATALLNGLALVTRNVKDFEPVPRLKVRAPTQ